MSEKPLVMILIGSDSDLPVIKPCLEMLNKFDVPFEIEVSSAHRSPERTSNFTRSAKEKGIKVMIIGAGAAGLRGRFPDLACLAQSSPRWGQGAADTVATECRPGDAGRFDHQWLAAVAQLATVR